MRSKTKVVIHWGVGGDFVERTASALPPRPWRGKCRCRNVDGGVKDRAVGPTMADKDIGTPRGLAGSVGMSPQT